MDCFTEKLIENVKKYSVLFDQSHSNYKNVRIKNKIWDEIAKEMKLGITGGDDLKKRWKNLKDCYAKYLRSEKTRTGQEAKSICRYKSWPWAQHMEAFRSFLQFAPTESNITNNGITQSSEEVNEERASSNEQLIEDREIKPLTKESSSGQENRSPKIVPTGNKLGKKRKGSTKPQSSSVHKIIHFLDQKRRNTEPHLDEIDLIFKGYAASVKKLSPRRQTMIKFKVAQIIMAEELSQQEETEVPNRSETSFSLHSALSSTANTSAGSSDDTPSYLANPCRPSEDSDTSIY